MNRPYILSAFLIFFPGIDRQTNFFGNVKIEVYVGNQRFKFRELARVIANKKFNGILLQKLF